MKDFVILLPLVIGVIVTVIAGPEYILAVLVAAAAFLAVAFSIEKLDARNRKTLPPTKK